MPEPVAQVGARLQLYYGTVGGSPTTEILGIDNLDFPELTGADIKNTRYSTQGKTHDYVPGYSEGGEVGVTKVFTASDETTMRGLYQVRKSWKVQVNDENGGHYDFEGYMNKIGPALPVDEMLKQKFSIKVCTLPVWTAGTGS
jgi:hypothetical protein